MATLDKCFTVEIEKGTQTVFLTANSGQYLKVFGVDTAGTTFTNASGGAVTVSNTVDKPSKHKLTLVATGSDIIIDNNGSIYYRTYPDVYDIDSTGLVGAHPSGRKG